MVIGEPKTFFFVIHGKFEAEDEGDAWDKLYNILKETRLEAQIDSVEEEEEEEEVSK